MVLFGPAQQESLGRITTLGFEERQLLFGFDSFRDGFQLEMMSHGNDGGDQPARAGLAGQIGDEGTIDLDRVQGKPPQIAEGRVPGPEIVHEQPDAPPLKGFENEVGPLQILHGYGFGDLEFESGRLEAGFVQGPIDGVEKCWIVELPSGQIDGHAFPTRARHRGLAGECYHVMADLRDEVRGLGDSDELGRLDGPALRVAPAQERLPGFHRGGVEADDGLIGEKEFSGDQGPAQAAFQADVLEKTGAHGRGVELGPITTQFLRDVAWGQLDFFIVDMPPGTGDAQLSLVQATQVNGAIIVTTPQEVAVGDALRGVKMFQRTGVPVLGVVENMSWLECPHCGKPTAIFGSGGGQRLADECEIPLLAQIPMYPRIMEGGDTGRPIVVSDGQSAAAVVLSGLAARLVDMSGAKR